jgi:hypothetical protein
MLAEHGEERTLCMQAAVFCLHNHERAAGEWRSLRVKVFCGGDNFENAVHRTVLKAINERRSKRPRQNRVLSVRLLPTAPSVVPEHVDAGRWVAAARG